MRKDYITLKTRLTKGVRFPDFLMRSYITQTSKILYALMLHRTMREKNEDGEGHLFIEWSIPDQALELSKSKATIKRSLLELEIEGLIEREQKGVGKPGRIYVLL